MKTIKQIADEIGATKTAVQKRMAREPLYTQITPHITICGVTKYIDKSGENIIKAAFGRVDMGINTGIDRVDTLLAMVSEQQKTIQEQTNSIRQLTAALEHTAANLHAAQALHAGTIQQQLIDGSSPIQPEQVGGKSCKSVIQKILKFI
jgi:hypothetical protein